MHEFDSVSVSTYEASSLAAKLTERSGEGWDVVAIVPTGSEITAFLRRAGATEDAASPAAAEPAPVVETAAAAEPSGWGAAPEASSTGWAATTTSAPADASAPAAASWGTSTAAPAATAPATPSVPAGWYADPALRFELRYWDGSAWTEHVSRAGQQYTDPPVA